MFDDAARTQTADDHVVEARTQLLADLESLIDRGLVLVEEFDAEPRFHLTADGRAAIEEPEGAA